MTSWEKQHADSWKNYEHIKKAARAVSFFVAPAALSQMKDINQENHGESIVRHHGNEIVDGCDERAGNHSRINVNFMEKTYGNYRA